MTASNLSNALVKHTAFVHATGSIQQCLEEAASGPDAVCLAVVGPSGAGKSTVLENFELAHPRKRVKSGLKVTVLRVKVPSNPTVKALAAELLDSLGDPLATKGTEYDLTIRLRKLLKQAGTRMIILDEFQHFVDKASSKVQHHVADSLKIIADDTGVALVVAGLPHCLSVINSNEQLARRFCAPVELPRFDWGVSASESAPIPWSEYWSHWFHPVDHWRKSV